MPKGESKTNREKRAEAKKRDRRKRYRRSQNLLLRNTPEGHRDYNRTEVPWRERQYARDLL
jgi:hypothetical protein